MTAQKVAGHCPMGCGATLTASDYQIVCTRPGCPEPTAVSKLLGVDEPEHIVTLEELDFIVRHPLRERLNDELERCVVHKQLRALPGPPRAPGTYTLIIAGASAADWVWLASDGTPS